MHRREWRQPGHEIPVDTTTLKGSVRDDFEIVDPETGALKVKGTGRATFDNFGPYNGFIFADVTGGAHLVASVSVEHFGISIPILLDEAVLEPGGAPRTDLRGPVVFKVGGPLASHPFDTGVVQEGGCSDDFWH